MLRSSRKVLTLRLAPDGYSISAGSLHGGKWQPWPATHEAAAGLTQRLAELTLAEAAQCPQLDLVIDSAYARTQVVQFPAGVRKPAERAAFLKASFRNVFGQEANDWHIVAESTYAGEAVPAVAIDTSLMQAISTLCTRHDMQLHSLRTHFVDCFNRLRGQLSGHVGAFALLEHERISLGLWHKRSWVALSTLAMRADDGPGLAAFHAQMLSRASAPLDAGTLYVAGSKKPFSVPLADGWAIQWLTADTH